MKTANCGTTLCTECWITCDFCDENNCLGGCMSDNPIWQCKGDSCNKMNCMECAGTALVRYCEHCDTPYCSDCRLANCKRISDAGLSSCDGCFELLEENNWNSRHNQQRRIRWVVGGGIAKWMRLRLIFLNWGWLRLIPNVWPHNLCMHTLFG